MSEDKKENTEQVLQWFNHFVDYIGNINSNLYNEACEYADAQEEETKTKMSDSEHLQWIHDRIVNVYGENENVDFLIRFRTIINEFSNQNKDE